ncbi:MAG: hypothetical protein ACE5FN_05410 [Leptospirillia bacterium]
MKRLLEKLAADLTEPMAMTDQVVRSLTDRCELQSNQVTAFLTEKSDSLDETMIDTVFSPMYTPTWEDRARYVEDRERVRITPVVLGLIVTELVDRKLTATYLYEDDTIRMLLPEVIIDRWVRRLHLEDQLSKKISAAIEATVPIDDQAQVKAMVGHTAWQAAGREEILLSFLTGFSRTGRFLLSKFEYLTGLMQTYRPRDVAHFKDQLDALIKSYHEDTGEHFFDVQLKEAHVNTGTIPPVKDSHTSDRQRQISLATQLQADLAEFSASAN